MDARGVAIVGAGKIGESLLAGLLSSEWRSPDEIVVTGRRPERVDELVERYGVRGTTSNAEATVHEGIAGICAGAHADEEHLALAEDVLRHLGRVVRVPEKYMDAVTAVSGSGPAYF